MNRASWLCSPDEIPVALEPVTFVDTERRLEDWVEADPSILGDGLIIVGRQVQFHGGPADLIAIDPQGRWVVIEIKRGRNTRQDVAQAIDYGSSLALEPADQLRGRLISGLQDKPYREAAIGAIDAALADEEDLPREVAYLLTGVGVHESAERMQQYLNHGGMDVRIVTLEAHRAHDGRIVLSREVVSDDVGDSSSTGPTESENWDIGIARIRSIAEDCQVLAPFDRWLEAAREAGLSARPYKRAIMIAPPTHKNAFLMVGRPVPGGGIRFNHGAREFAQWFPWISPEHVERELGESERGMGSVYAGADLERYLSGVEKLLTESFPPPPEFESFMQQQQWDRERFIAAFTSRPALQATVSQFLNAANASYGSGAVGQAHLTFDEGGPQILQLSTAGKLRGMWTLGSRDASDPAWDPLKHLLAAWGGVGPGGEAPKIDLDDLSDDDIESILRVARATSQALQ